MKKIYILSSCSTCNRILQELNPKNFDEIIDIKKTPIEASTLEEASKQLRSYEAIFNKRAIKFRPIKDTIKSNEDYKNLLLNEYTFLKRPLYFIDGQYFAGNSKSTVDKVKSLL